MYGEGNGIPLQYSCLENPMDRGAWWVLHEVIKSRARLGDYTDWLAQTLSFPYIWKSLLGNFTLMRLLWWVSVVQGGESRVFVLTVTWRMLQARAPQWEEKALSHHLLRKNKQSYLTQFCSISVQGSSAVIEVKAKPAVVVFCWFFNDSRWEAKMMNTVFWKLV